MQRTVTQGTELHVTFKVEQPFAQGWFCFLSGGGDGARLRLDLFRIYEGEYVPWKSPARGAAAASAAGELPFCRCEL